MAITNKSTKTSAGEDVENRGPWCTVGGNANWCGHCGRNTILFTISQMMYFTSQWLFCNYQFVFYCLHFIHPFTKPSSHLATTKMFSVSMSLFLFCLFICFVFQISFVWCKYCYPSFLFICLFPFSWSILFQPISFSLCVSFYLKQVSYRQHVRVLFVIYSSSTYFLTGALINLLLI